MPAFTFGQSFLEQMNRGQAQASSNAELQLRAQQVQQQLLTEQVQREMMRAQQALAESEFRLTEQKWEEGERDRVKAQTRNIDANTDLTEEQAKSEKTHRDLLRSRIGLNDAEINRIKAVTGLTNEKILSEIESRELTKAQVRNMDVSTLFKGKQIELADQQIENMAAELDMTRAQIETMLVERGLIGQKILNEQTRNEFMEAELERFKDNRFVVKNGLGEPLGIEDGRVLTFDQLDRMIRTGTAEQAAALREEATRQGLRIEDEKWELQKQIGEQGVEAYDASMRAANQTTVGDVLTELDTDSGFFERNFSFMNPVDRFKMFFNAQNTPEARQQIRMAMERSTTSEADKKSLQSALDMMNRSDLGLFGYDLGEIPVSKSAFNPAAQQGATEATMNLGRSIARYPQLGAPFVPSYGSAAMGLQPDNMLAPALQQDAMMRGAQLRMPQNFLNNDR